MLPFQFLFEKRKNLPFFLGYFLPLASGHSPAYSLVPALGRLLMEDQDSVRNLDSFLVVMWAYLSSAS